MTIKWREHERSLIGLTGGILIFRYLWEWCRLSAHQIGLQYAAPFTAAHESFHYFSRVFLPQIATVWILLLAYFRLNQVISSCLAPTGRKSFGTWLWTILQVVGLIYVIGPGINFFSFYVNPFYRTVSPLFTYPLLFGFHPQPFLNTFGGMDVAAFIVIAYLIYGGLREGLIRYIEGHRTRRDYRVMIINQVTLTLVVLFLLPVFSSVFNLISDDAYYSYYFAFVPAVVLVFNANLYWLFPQKGDHSLFNWRFLGPLLFLTFVLTLAFSIFLASQWSLPAVLGLWAAQVFIFTPIAWLQFKQRRDQILSLRGVEEKLAKSTADLQMLRMQINPHFLFNALNTLYGTALIEKSTNTAEGIQKLGDMMRFMLHENTQDYIGIDKEIAYLENYVALQKLRTQTSPDILIEAYINHEGCQGQIAPMLLIPFVENAFKHGVSLAEKSWIKIKLECQEGSIDFEVKNSIHPSMGTDTEKGHSGIGLQNVRERLLLLYPGRHELRYGVQQNEFIAKLSITQLN